MSLVTAFIFMVAVYHILPKPENVAQFSLTALHKMWKLASGMMGITLLSLLLIQTDIEEPSQMQLQI